MVNRVFTDDHPELVRLSSEFVCMKFCESDDKEMYYRAAGYFLPQWYWQPILAITRPDGSEINPKWRRTHEAIGVDELVAILKSALEVSGKGMAPDVAADARRSLDGAFDAAVVGERAKSAAVCRALVETVPRGSVRRGAEALLRYLSFVDSLDSLEAALEALPEGTAGADDARNAISMFRFLEFGEALPLIESAVAAGSTASKLAGSILEKARAASDAFVRIHGVSTGRFRFGPDINHDLRVELTVDRCAFAGAAVQVYALLKDGSCFAHWEKFEGLPVSPSQRVSFFLPLDLCADPSQITGLRAELWVGATMLCESGPASAAGGEAWWKRDEYHPLGGAEIGRSTFASPSLYARSDSGLAYGRDVLEIGRQAQGDRAHEEMVEAFKALDWRRFSPDSQSAVWRIVGLGSASLKWAVPLADREGAITTLQMIPVLSRIGKPEAAGCLVDIVGADDVTLPGSAIRALSWFEGEDGVDTSQLHRYLESDRETLRWFAAESLSYVGGPRDVLPLMKMWREANPGSRSARAAAAALVAVTGRTFGMDPDRDFSKQGDPLREFAQWWEKSKDAPRAVWMAQAVEETWKGRPGLAEAVTAGDRKAAKAILEVLVSSRSRDIQRNGILLALLTGEDSLGEAVFKAYSAMAERHPNESVARNYLWRHCDESIVSGFVSMLREPSNFNRALDFLLTVTRMWEFCPADSRSARARIGTAEMFEKWLEERRGKLEWDASERRFGR